MKPHWHDACQHNRPRDQFLGTIASSEVEGSAAGAPFDVFVYQDNALNASKPDMHVCIRYGAEPSMYVSPGNVEDFLDRIRTGSWPAYYIRAAKLIQAWLENKR